MVAGRLGECKASREWAPASQAGRLLDQIVFPHQTSNKSNRSRNSLVIQQLGLCFHCQGVGSFPGQGIKIPQAAWPGAPPKKKLFGNNVWAKQFTFVYQIQPMGDDTFATQNTGFLSLNTTDILGQMTLSGEGAIHCRMFSSTPGLYSLDANSIPLPF